MNRPTGAKEDASAMKLMKVTEASALELYPILLPPDPFEATTPEGWRPSMVSASRG
jgi:hypothetical protein